MELGSFENFKTEDELREALGYMDAETLQKTLAYLIKVYIIDKDFTVPDTPDETTVQRNGATSISLGLTDFTGAISELKKNYAFPELQKFSIEDGKVYLTHKNEPILLSEQAAKQTVSDDKPDSKPDNTNANPTTQDRFKNLEL